MTLNEFPVFVCTLSGRDPSRALPALAGVGRPAPGPYRLAASEQAQKYLNQPGPGTSRRRPPEPRPRRAGRLASLAILCISNFEGRAGLPAERRGFIRPGRSLP
jgi:hypothetical protein